MNSNVTFELTLGEILIVIGFVWLLYNLGSVGKDLFWEWFDRHVEKQARVVKQNAVRKGYTPTPPPRTPHPPRVNIPPRTERDMTSEYQGRHATDPNMKKPPMVDHPVMHDVSHVDPVMSGVPVAGPLANRWSSGGYEPAFGVSVGPNGTSLINLGEYEPPEVPADTSTIYDGQVVEDEEDPLLRSRAERQEFPFYVNRDKNSSTVHRKDCSRVKKMIEDNLLDPWLWAKTPGEAVHFAKEQDLHLCGICKPGLQVTQ